WLGLGRINHPRLWLGLSLMSNLGLLFTFKYFNFAAEVLTQTLALGGWQLSLPTLQALLPVGISFYTFQTLSYTIDVYRGRLEPTRNLLHFAVFVIFFPQLVAGPIVRASEFLPQLRARARLATGQVSGGLFLIATGLVKKVAIADYLSVNLVDRVFDQPEGYTAVEVVLALYAFTLQIYCDFSGYTDVARGTAQLLGFRLPENFDRPYQATNPAEFWRRWHMTLSSWLRDYLYFPLGGSRCGPLRAYFNLWLTLFLIGIWHGASWTFVIYGLLQAGAMVLHRFVHRQVSAWRVRRSARVAPALAAASSADPFASLFRRLGFRFGEGAASASRLSAWWSAWGWRGLKVVACLQFVVFSRILFRAQSLDNAEAVTARLWSHTSSVAQLSAGVWAVLVLGFAAHYLPRGVFASVERVFVRLPPLWQGLALTALGFALARVATAETVPYIYFQF
ncbi:MAG: MBOAT family O-acyltransferase, partial [Polyangiales bacterium]